MWLKIWTWLKLFRKDLFVLLIAARNPATPKYIKTSLLVALVYMVSPVDLIPDALPVVGLLDDAVLVPAAICALMNLLPSEVRHDSEVKAQRLGKKMPYLLLGAAVLVFAWVMLVLWAVYSLIFK